MAVNAAEVAAQHEAQESGTDATPEQDSITPVLPEGGEPESSTEPVVEPVAPDFDALFSNEEHRSALRERFLNEDDGIKQRIKDAENTGGQRKEADLRRVAASDEQVQARLFQAYKAMREAETGEVFDPQIFDQQRYQQFVRATASATAANRDEKIEEVSVAWEQWTAGQEIPAEKRVMLAGIRAEHGPTSAEYFNATRDVVRELDRAQTLGAAKLADIPDSAPLHKEIVAVHKKLWADELRAQIATTGRAAGPTTIPESPGGTKASGNTLTVDQYTGGSAGDRARWTKEGYKVVDAAGNVVSE